MLFPYTYVPHAMEKMQEFVCFIFDEVWCKAPSIEYGIDLFEPADGLYQIMNELYRRDLAGKLKDGAGKLFYESVNEIFNEFKSLTEEEVAEYRSIFTANNQIEELCSGSASSIPVIYDSLPPVQSALNEKIENFFKKLYSSGFFDLKFVIEAIGSSIGEYYKDFVRENDGGICPFCGLHRLDGKYDPTREAFDHYLPKGKYPFNSVNLKNLAPSCYKCNSGNKLEQDPLYDKQNNRRKAFYPFAATQSDIIVSVRILDTNWCDLTPEKLSVDIQSVASPEETNTWKELFRIEQRYVSMCCEKNGGIYWRNRVLNECNNYNLSVQEMLNAELQTAGSSPWVEANFLKKAFLEGCNETGMF